MGIEVFVDDVLVAFSGTVEFEEVVEEAKVPVGGFGSEFGEEGMAVYGIEVDGIGKEGEDTRTTIIGRMDVEELLELELGGGIRTPWDLVGGRGR
ncbi:hypothetical protein AGMMS49936_07260 [Endomicrobiia bacterium]|nr:hypothetical protein AGMMS49936_07260 [Endomicrobiia bacterium]